MSTGRIISISAVAIVGIFFGGVVMIMGMSMLKKPPAAAEQSEHSLRVITMLMEPRTVPVRLVENGVAHARDVVAIAPDVSGSVVNVHPKLELGEIVPKGEVLFEIDPRNYDAAVAVAEAEKSRLAATVNRIKTQWANDRERLKTLERSRDLAEAEFRRLKQLFEDDEVGTRSGVEGAERQYNAAHDAVDQMQQMLSIYPITINETESMLEAAIASAEKSQADLARTKVEAPFDARVLQVSIEEGTFVGPGAPVVTLADDSILELSVALDSSDVRQWLPFTENSAPTETAWFGSLEPVDCVVKWTESKEEHQWRGQLHRVERYEQDTRKVAVAVRVTAEDATRPLRGEMPLVDGMFCEVVIPGKDMVGVYELPQWAVSYDGSVDEGDVYLSVDNRLKTTRVRVVRRDEESVYVSDGIAPGDVAVVTRLINPLENSLLEVVKPGEDTD